MVYGSAPLAQSERMDNHAHYRILYSTKLKWRSVQNPPAILLGGFCPAKRLGPGPSELKAQGGLDISRPIDHTPAASGHAEVAVEGISIDSGESMPVESVGDIQLEQDYLAFADLGSLDDGKVFVLIARTSPPPDSGWNVSEDITTTGSQRRVAGIHECRAVSGGGGGCRTDRRRIELKDSAALEAAAIPAADELRATVHQLDPMAAVRAFLQGGRPRARAKYRLPRIKAETVVAAAVRVRRGVLIDDRRRSALVAVNRADLPSSEDLAGHAVTQILLPWPDG